MMFSEQFIQDAICKPNRVQKVMRMLGKDWQFDNDHDVVYPQFSFEGKRLDVMATFGKRQHLLIVEVKSGAAGIDGLQQLDEVLPI